MSPAARSPAHERIPVCGRTKRHLHKMPRRTSRPVHLGAPTGQGGGLRQLPCAARFEKRVFPDSGEHPGIVPAVPCCRENIVARTRDLFGRSGAQSGGPGCTVHGLPQRHAWFGCQPVLLQADALARGVTLPSPTPIKLHISNLCPGFRKSCALDKICARMRRIRAASCDQSNFCLCSPSP